MTYYYVSGYKENSVDTCRGCVMERYSSDFVYLNSSSKEDIIDWIAEYKAYESNLGESEYEIQLLIDGKTEYLLEEDASDEYNEILGEANSRSVKIISDRKIEKERQKKLEEIENQEKIRLKELEELGKLKQKYEN